ncbi:class I SAM-dependent methyltransferase [Flexithrix dorotheae]|uniref:class I SAM-dependent methyltransferase n=1 Tax=Flexithrix dorotheae TaxID=70993 RepID=UPI00037E55B7|nr:methyltransferase domain-containing protein [Flexithrix dorotheae]
MDQKKHNEKIVAQFSKQASGYTSLPSHSEALERLLQLSSVQQDDNVLDIACGSGIVSCEFAKIARHVTGIDMTVKMIDEARKLQVKKGLQKISWEIGDVTDLPYADNHFSIVVSRFGFHHFLNPFQVLSEMKRVCKPKGVVMVVDVSLPDTKIEKFNEMEKNRDNSHVAALSYTAFQKLFKKAGFSQVQQDEYVMQIGFDEQLAASFPTNIEALRKMILQDVGKDELGVNVTKINEKVYLNYPIHIFCARKS